MLAGKGQRLVCSQGGLRKPSRQGGLANTRALGLK